MSKKRDAPRVLFELTEESDLQKRRALRDELIKLLQDEEDSTWTDGQLRLLRKQQDTISARLRAARTKKESKSARRKKRVRDAAQGEWRESPDLSVNRVATLVRQKKKSPSHSTIRAWIADLKTR